MTPERMLSMVLAIGFLGAPALALLYGPAPGLFVLIVSLGITIGLARSARSSIDGGQRKRLEALILMNGVLLVAAVVGLVLVTV